MNTDIIKMNIVDSALNPVQSQKYNLILADPPWTYKRQNGRGTINQSAGDIRYKTLSLSDLKQMELPAEDDCALLLWVTMPLLDKGLELMNAWGFTYKTNFFTWVKTNKKSGTPFFGAGSYTAANVELLLLGVKGKITQFKKKHVSSVIMQPVRGHSQKPECIKDKIHEIYPDIQKLEMFARCTVNPHYHYFGNQIEKYHGMNETEIQTVLKQESAEQRQKKKKRKLTNNK